MRKWVAKVFEATSKKRMKTESSGANDKSKAKYVPFGRIVVDGGQELEAVLEHRESHPSVQDYVYPRGEKTAGEKACGATPGCICEAELHERPPSGNGRHAQPLYPSEFDKLALLRTAYDR